MENLAVDREKGTYTFTEKGRMYCFPSVTTIIRNVYWENPWVTDAGLERGRLVHKASWLLDGGGGGHGLNWHTLHASLVGPTRAYQNFKDKEGFVPLLNEENVRSLRYRFAGRPDKLGYFLLNKKLRSQVAIIDLKVGKVEPWTGIQLAAYRVAYKEMHPKMRMEHIARFALELKDNEDYQLHPMVDPDDFAFFTGGMRVYYFLQKYYPGRRRVR